jgi:hypothetical protein
VSVPERRIVWAAAARILLVTLASAAAFAGCGAGDESTSSCENVRGGPDAAVSVWSCADDSDLTALMDKYDFESCRRVEGMDADVNPKDLAYQCTK